MAIENANSHPYKVAITKESGEMYANSHPYQVVIVGGGGGQEGRVVDELPEVGEPGYIYLVLKEESSEGNIYDEYMWVLQQDGETYGWEHIGATNEVRVPTVVQTTGTSTEDVMSQKAVTDALASAGPTVVQTTGTSSTDVMSQNATTSMVFSANNYDYGRVGIKIKSDGIGGSQSVRIGHENVVYGQGISIGWGTSGISSSSDGNVTIRGGGGGNSTYGARASNAIAIGNGFTDVYGNSSVAIGGSATVDRNVTYAIALGNSSKATMKGQMQIGLSDGSTNGYNNSQYRLLTGLYDPQSDHDAATKGYVDTAVASAGGAEEINSTDWSALWQ